ncbi:MAG: hypothetical protein H3C29_01580 [Simplicispira suum]|uniref:hypothetical protein n=1 Tax=Simplicispira suum TaxID=2109915 RepID=UPI001C6BEAF1|nr:hypothetical protein [Simplicispira suum]MBW7831880.1 hypothetical protein [Simplicispira suum]
MRRREQRQQTVVVWRNAAEIKAHEIKFPITAQRMPDPGGRGLGFGVKSVFNAGQIHVNSYYFNSAI